MTDAIILKNISKKFNLVHETSKFYLFKRKEHEFNKERVRILQKMKNVLPELNKHEKNKE